MKLLKLGIIIVLSVVIVLICLGLLVWQKNSNSLEKTDLIKAYKPAMVKVEMNAIDFARNNPAYTIYGNYQRLKKGIRLGYPGVSVNYYLTEMNPTWVYALFFNPRNISINATVWLNSNLAGMLRLQRGWNRIKFSLPAGYQKQGENALLFIIQDGQAGLILSKLYFSRSAFEYSRLKGGISFTENTIWINNRGEVSYYLDCPQNASLEYWINIKSKVSSQNKATLNMTIKAESDIHQNEINQEFALYGKENAWKKYGAKLKHFGNQKIKLTFAVNYKNRWIPGGVEIGLKARLTGKRRVNYKPGELKAKYNGYNVLLIILDAASASRLNIYGYKIITAPHIDYLSKKSHVFTRAYSAGVFTRGSTASLFTSLYPDSHEVMNFQYTLSDGAKTLAELFQMSGYKTALFSANGNVSEETGLRQGFSDYFPLFRSQPPEFTDEIIDWLSKNKKNKFFLYAHYRHPHPPYDAPYALRQRFNSSSLPTLIKNNDLVGNIYNGNIIPDQEQLSYLTSQYNANLYYVDESVGTLLSYVSSNELKENTIIIITADHGEALGEHDIFGHIWDLYMDSLWIPLIIHMPSFSTRTDVDQMVDTVDIMPTLIELTGLKNKPAIMQGMSFAPCLLNTRCVTKGYAYSQSISRKFASLIDSDYHLIFDSVSRKWELYNLVEDPGEKNDLSNIYPVMMGYYRNKILQMRKINIELKQEMIQLWNEGEFTPAGEVLENLRALGYID
ncbi:MAG: hypothetical protein A2Y62_21295 [Candidatus Fischerbacteria bacterium RBG_13_37_8]|uniref:Sulfatase N-terminal domain-containing protein n=1 Tax=Candidatus Fischerbacteria bacterium RBG_13_37_8 TaxID=1817863 RepID=A0A1F5VNZ0_9BACT|nr:MAG: hypothetical protein A2Y62_21295 [Candidatus Fischerbacteria bacterium RBG_13_37_8]